MKFTTADVCGTPSFSIAFRVMMSTRPSWMMRAFRSCPVSTCPCTGGMSSAGDGCGPPGTVLRAPASILSTRDSGMAKVFSPMVYSTRPFTCWVESATMFLPLFRWMTSAWAPRQNAVRNRNVNLDRKRENCSNYAQSMKQGFYLITKIMTFCLCLAAAPPSGQAQAQPADAVTLYRQILSPALDVKDVYKVRRVAIDREDLH